MPPVLRVVMTWIYFAAIMAVLGAILGLVSKKIFYSVE